MRSAVITFPASNCDRDAVVALRKVTKEEPVRVWHRETELPDVDFVVVPGGFSYGDYLRSGAVAARSPIIRDLVRKANAGLPVAGFCNGFQILCEAGLLPGTLMRNQGLKFVCNFQPLSVANRNTRFTRLYKDEGITIPIAHHDGNYYADDETLERVEGEGQVVFRYEGEVNGSRNDIAGVVNAAGNVLGMMPHPERAVDPLTGGTDGVALFKSVMESL